MPNPHSTAQHPRTSIPTARLAGLLSRWTRRQITELLQQKDQVNDANALQDLEQLLPAASAAANKRPHMGGQNLISAFDAPFPEALKNIPDPPLVLAYRGDPDVLHRPAVAVVGARRCTTQGRNWAYDTAAQLAAAGCCVVSGLAFGIDAAAHDGALSVGGATAAFIGSGLDRIYPAAHNSLAQRIIDEGGVIFSEYPAHASARKHRFPERNRLISGSAVATVIVEASAHSGSLITARMAAEQGREVMAVPGPVAAPVSAGCHRLIQQGAALVTCAAEILQNLNLPVQVDSRARDMVLDELQQAIFDALQGYPLTLDELILRLGRPGSVLLEALARMELAGFVGQSPLGYIRTSIQRPPGP